tara:strand:+ start:2578 stop:2838 length:261 start_codon:yes stop_codon:yes gene_type:complete
MFKIFNKKDFNQIDVINYLKEQDINAADLGGQTFVSNEVPAIVNMPNNQYVILGFEQPISTTSSKSFLAAMHSVESSIGFQLFGYN